MIDVIHSLPLLVTALLVATGRSSVIVAGMCGAAVAILVAGLAAPVSMDAMALLGAVARGLWLACLVGAVILGGLFFRECTLPPTPDTTDTRPVSEWLRRRRVFSACFLFGPFAEAATGFGVGQVATVALLLRSGMAPLYVVVLGLFSQVLVPWGAMANGTFVGAEFAGISPRVLGIHSALLSVPLLLTWAVLFWRLAAKAGLPGSPAHAAMDIGWIAAALAMLVIANDQLGPEVACMAALGPLIAAHVLIEERPDRTRWRSFAVIGAPYLLLIAGLASSRAVPAVNEWLRDAGSVQPFADVSAWFPLLHPGSWLAAIGMAAVTAASRISVIPEAVRSAVSRGGRAVLTIAVYLVMARIMLDSGMAAAVSSSISAVLGAQAAILTPWLAGAFAFLAGSSNASNALLMSSQVSLAAERGLPIVWMAALQNCAAAALTMLSPVRVAMGCALVRREVVERDVYRRAWPLGIAPLIVLTIAASALVLAQRS